MTLPLTITSEFWGSCMEVHYGVEYPWIHALLLALSPVKLLLKLTLTNQWYRCHEQSKNFEQYDFNATYYGKYSGFTGALTLLTSAVPGVSITPCLVLQRSIQILGYLLWLLEVWSVDHQDEVCMHTSLVKKRKNSILLLQWIVVVFRLILMCCCS